MMHRDGILVIGHGTRDSRGQGEFLRIVQMMAGRAEQPVEAAFLELVEPSIEQGLERLIARGIRQVTAIPVLLFTAGHARRDVPDGLAHAAAQLQRAGLWNAADPLQIRQTEPLDCHPRIVALSELRYQHALAERAPVPAEETCLVLISRGSSDPQTPANLRRLAESRRQPAPYGRFELGFVAAAQPSLKDALSAAAQSSARRIVVQPHLLFPGQVLDEVRTAVAQAAREYSDREWIIADVLGADPELAVALLDLI